ncbi:MAG: D-alanyl-D-alanine dipeptidase [Candidatus Solibacter sp.]|nr:D-alanyl-D-alanine dipeptidase [Candidatus Solibacter sp.]
MPRLAALLLLLLLPLAAQDVFRLQPARPIAQLRIEALKQSPPVETGPFRPHDLVNVATIDPSIRLDIRYAGTDNFLSAPIYESARAYLQRPAAEALLRAHNRLKPSGYGILVHDTYRPWFVTWIFWEATPPHLKDFVANPARGSKHNRGCAADVTLYDLKSGAPVEMPSLYDEMSERAYPDFPGGTPLQRQLRDLLRTAMESEGFTVYEYEWWHFDYKDWRHYPIGNQTFQQLESHR